MPDGNELLRALLGGSQEGCSKPDQRSQSQAVSKPPRPARTHPLYPGTRGSTQSSKQRRSRSNSAASQSAGTQSQIPRSHTVGGQPVSPARACQQGDRLVLVLFRLLLA